jgi:hypothetical protein
MPWHGAGQRYRCAESWWHLGEVWEQFEVLSRYWLFGGWAVDFHAGRVTRDHADIDLAV